MPVVRHAEVPDDVRTVAIGKTPPTPRQQLNSRQLATIAGYAVLGLISVLVLSLTAYAWSQFTALDNGVRRSSAVIAAGARKSPNGDTNILIMGLDSRLDENGDPLPADIYNALHAGDVGDYNADVLMLLHIPAHGRAVAISIPRDDYVNLPGCPHKVCQQKIKQAYGLARDQANQRLQAEGMIGPTLEQDARDAGRKEEVDTVSQLLGGVPIDHFVEVSLVAFAQLAQVVQPLVVCVPNTGWQRLDAAQALAFIRPDRTDDLERRQQAFVSALAVGLNQAGTVTSPSKTSAILDVAERNIAVDSGFDLMTFALTATNTSFNTLPMDHVQHLGGTIGDVGIVDPAVIRTDVQRLLNPGIPLRTPQPVPTTTAAPTTTTSPVPAGVVDVLNRSGRGGAAGDLANALAAKGFTPGTTGTESPTARTTIVEYDSADAQAAARSVAQLLGGVTVQHSTTVPTGHVRVLIGRDFRQPANTTTNPASPTTTVPTTPPDSVTASGPLPGELLPCAR